MSNLASLRLSPISVGSWSALQRGGQAALWLGALLAWPALSQQRPSDFPREDFMAPDGPVRAVVETNGVIYIGGLFDYVSPSRQTGAAMESISGTPFQNFPKFIGAVKAVVANPDGGWFVGGQFSHAGDLPIANLAYVHADMTVDRDWHPEPDGAVLALALDGERLFVGGQFSHIAGQEHLLLAALEPRSGTAVLVSQNGTNFSWRADCTNSAPNPSVNTLLVSSGRLFVGGYFRSINGEERLHLASLEAATGRVELWTPNGYAGAESGTRVDAMALSGQTLYLGGTFSTFGGKITPGVIRRFAAAVDITKDLADAVLPWNPDADAPVTSLAIACDTVFIGGTFNNIGGQERHHIAAVDAVRGQATAWNADANDDVLSLQLAGNVLFAGGRFTHIGGQPREFLAALDTSLGHATSWQSPADFGVTGLSVGGGTVVAGGLLPPGGQFRKNLAAFDARTGALLPWNPQATGVTFVNWLLYEGVYGLAVSDDVIYVAGAFTSVNGVTRNRLAAVDAVTGTLLPWDPNANNMAETFLVTPNAIYAAGLFTQVGGVARKGLAAFELGTGSVKAWNPHPDDKVTALAYSENAAGLGLVYAGGRFLHMGGQLRKRLAALDTTAGLATAWNPNVNDQVSTLLPFGDSIYFGGQFSTVGGQARQHLAAVSTDTATLSCWDPHPQASQDGLPRASGANALLAVDGVIHVAGRFNQLAGATANNLGALSPDCPATASAWNPAIDTSVATLTGGRQIVAGGGFHFIKGQYHPFLAVFPPEGAPRVTRQPATTLVKVGDAVALEAEVVGDAPLVYQWLFNGTNLPGATSRHLSFASAQLAQTGDYMLVITNALGLVHSSPARIIVVQPVSILSHPLSQTVAPGNTITLEVVASGSPTPIYQWRRNGENIPGAVYPSYTITNAQPADGGTYGVVVANTGGATSSIPALVLITSPGLPFVDVLAVLAERGTITGISGLGSGSNLTATKEPGELNHAGKVGGPSVWLRWVAPASGIATFSTRGSSFDTLLAIYTGPDLSHLTPVAADEDRGGFLTSRAAFNATNGTEYLVAVDGFAGASGNIVLSWSLDTTTVPFPRIVTEPLNQTVQRGVPVPARFEVVVSSDSAVSYQWYFGCQVLAGQTNATLILAQIGPAAVGEYHVVVMNASSQVAESVPAVLEIGPETKVVSRDKVEDIINPPDGGIGRFAAASSSGFLSVSLGTTAGQTINNKGATHSADEPNHCNVLGGASRWLGLLAPADGTLVIDTIGSRIDTVLAVYAEPTNVLYLYSQLLACDNNSAPDGIRSVVRLEAEAGKGYLVVVDGVNQAEGTIQINWKLGQGPVPDASMPLDTTVAVGGSIVLRARTTNGIPSPAYQWYWNGQRLLGATNVNLILSNAQPSQSGIYTVSASNFVNPTLETNAVLRVGAPYVLSEAATATNGAFGFRLIGNAGRPVIVQTTTNLGGGPTIWTPVLTNPMAQSQVYIFDTNATRFRQRWYRVVVP